MSESDNDASVQEDADLVQQDAECVANSNESDPDYWKKFEERAKKRGVVYFSRIPPFMTPHKLRRMFEQFGEIGRIYLTPEDAAVARRRKKFKKNTRKNYIDGWMEFSKKSVAKRVAESLNNTPIGGKKRSKYAEDIWNIRYLKGFKWHHLTEKQALENAVRSQKIRNEVAAARKEHDFIAEKIQQAKVIANIEKRKAQKRQRDETDEVGAPAVLRTFKQKKPVITSQI